MHRTILSLTTMTIVEQKTGRTWRGYRVYWEPVGGDYADIIHSGVDLPAAVAALQEEARRTREAVSEVNLSDLVHHETGWTNGRPRMAPRRPTLRLIDGAKGDAA